MSATLYIDRPHTHFTNLDFLTGKVVVKLTSETQISGIQVKLEGESRTRLSGPRHPHHEQSDKKRTEIEVHKVRRSFSFLFFFALLPLLMDRIDLIQSPQSLPNPGCLQ